MRRALNICHQRVQCHVIELLHVVYINVNWENPIKISSIHRLADWLVGWLSERVQIAIIRSGKQADKIWESNDTTVQYLSRSRLTSIYRFPPRACTGAFTSHEHKHKFLEFSPGVLAGFLRGVFCTIRLMSFRILPGNKKAALKNTKSRQISYW